MPSRDTSDVAIPDVAELDLFVIMDALSGPHGAAPFWLLRNGTVCPADSSVCPSPSQQQHAISASYSKLG
jgi:hypothetical protein